MNKNESFRQTFIVNINTQIPKLKRMTRMNIFFSKKKRKRI